MDLLNVQNLCKKYETFELKDVSFSLEQGYIMGFIGRNGAGKTTTLKSMLNLVHPNSGSVKIMGMDFLPNEFACKQEIGLVLGGIDYYPQKRLIDVVNVVKRFYSEWDAEAFAGYAKKFNLDLRKKPIQLSAGMKVKFSLALALSHNAKLLILDEPTSGLDPVSRDELLEIFQGLIEGGERSILFSTHITSDLEKCADFITYIKEGRIIKSCDKDTFVSDYRLIQGKKEELPKAQPYLIGIKEHAFGFTGLIHAEDEAKCAAFESAKPDLESVMIYYEKEANV